MQRRLPLALPQLRKDLEISHDPEIRGRVRLVENELLFDPLKVEIDPERDHELVFLPRAHAEGLAVHDLHPEARAALIAD